jgi:hypothetical protein
MQLIVHAPLSLAADNATLPPWQLWSGNMIGTYPKSENWLLAVNSQERTIL